MKILPNKDALIAVNGTNRITGIPNSRGDICTQGVFRLSDFAHAVIIAIVGGTGHFKNARGTLTIHNQGLTFDWSVDCIPRPARPRRSQTQCHVA